MKEPATVIVPCGVGIKCNPDQFMCKPFDLFYIVFPSTTGVLLILLLIGFICKKPSGKDETESIKNAEEASFLLKELCPGNLEVILIYFPDSKQFKELNSKFRKWLDTFVSDVYDLYDEKFTEEIKENPEDWITEKLSNKRVILVCSKLSYECLCALRKSTKLESLEKDAMGDLCCRALAFVDNNFKEDYHRVICVRYEDLKISGVQFGSEKFNIVPNTEYLIPQHLEDIYKWLHGGVSPLENNYPWSDRHHAVKDLKDYIRNYRNSEENLFSVHFYDSKRI